MTLHHGDCLDVMAGMDPESVDAIVTDPPYGLEFMGKEWDRFGGDARQRDDPTFTKGERKYGLVRSGLGGAYGDDVRRATIAFQAWNQKWAEAAYRVAKPSAYLLAFGGTRTVHRMTVALEDAGWIIRDMLVWAYASGFPKSKASLKPAWEPIVMARKPGPLRMLAIDECRIPTEEGDRVEYGVTKSEAGGKHEGWARPWMKDGEEFNRRNAEAVERANTLGRWPANVILTDPTLGSGYSRFFEIPGGTSCDWCGVPIATPSSPPSSQAVGSAQSRAVIATDGLAGSTDLRMDSPTTSGTETSSWLDDDGITPLTPRSRPHGTSPASEPPSSPAKSPDVVSRGIAITTTTGVRSMCATCAAAITSATTSPSPEERNYPWAFLIPKAARADREPVMGGLPLEVAGIGHASGVNDAGEYLVRANQPHPPTIAAFLKEHRQRAGLSMAAIDKYLGTNTMYSWFEGRRGGYQLPTVDMWWKLKDLLDFDDRHDAVMTEVIGIKRERFKPNGKEQKVVQRQNSHPTVKPVDLMRHLVRLVTPTGGTVLDPFLGSGTTALAAEMEGFAWVGIEREAEYVAIAEARLNGTQRGLGLESA